MDNNLNEKSLIQNEVKTQNKNEHKKRIAFLLLLMIGTIVLGASSTYAWFTANQTVTVNTVTVNVEAQNGIQISADGTNWKSILQTDDIKGVKTTTYTSSVNQLPASMEPVSTIGNIDESGHMEMFYGAIASNVDGEYILTATKETDASGTDGKYVAFDVFLKVDSDTDIYMTPNSGVTTADAAEKGIKNAARMGFVVLGNTSSGSAISTIQGLNAGTSSAKYIWEPNYDVHTASGVTHAYDVYGEETTEEGAAQLAYSGVKAVITAEDNVVLNRDSATAYTTAEPDFFDTVDIAYSTIFDFSENFQVFSLQSGITKVRVYMWVEGQDVDCENNASGENINFDIQITTVDE